MIKRNLYLTSRATTSFSKRTFCTCLYRVARSRLTHFKWSQIIYGNRKKSAKPSINTSKYAIYYPQIASLFSENYIRQMATVYINALLQACLEDAVHAPPQVVNSRNFGNNGLFEFLNSHDTPTEHMVFQETLRKKSGTVRSGDRAGQVMSPKQEITVPNISRTTAILFRTI